MDLVVCLFIAVVSAGRRRVDCPAIVLALSLIGSLVACASSDSADAAFCEPVVIEELDPLSTQHILPGAEVSYLTSPPTSGPHLAQSTPSGALDEPLGETMQVTVLEGGRTLVQYQTGLSPDAIDDLRSLGSRRIVVAPNPDLDSPIVATRWRAKLTCSQSSSTELEAFSRAEGLPTEHVDGS